MRSAKLPPDCKGAHRVLSKKTLRPMILVPRLRLQGVTQTGSPSCLTVANASACASAVALPVVRASQPSVAAETRNLEWLWMSGLLVLPEGAKGKAAARDAWATES